MVQIAKPTPEPDERSAGFWSAASNHVVAMQRCGSCQRLAHPPVVICPACLSPETQFSFLAITGTGRLKTWTIMRDTFLPGFRPDIPWVVGEAELDDTPGIRLLARVAITNHIDLAIDTPIETVFEDVAPGISLPVFKLVDP